MQYPFTSANPFNQILEDTLRKPDGIYLVSIDRHAINDQSVSEITHVIDTVVHRDLVGPAAGRIAIEITGYEGDFRDPVEIPEIRTYFALLDEIIPFLVFFLENDESGSLVRFTGWLVDVFYENDDVIFDLDQLQSFLTGKSALISQACASWNIDPEPHLNRLWSAFDIEPDQSEDDSILG